MNPENEVPPDQMQSELNKTVKKYDEALKGMENEVPSDEDMKKAEELLPFHAIKVCTGKGGRTVVDDVQYEEKTLLNQGIVDARIVLASALSALRASWEKERNEIVTELLDWKKVHGDTLVMYSVVRKEKQALEERVRDMEEGFDEQVEEITRLKAENESLKDALNTAETQHGLETESTKYIFKRCDELRATNDTLTLALAEARELLMKHTLRVYLCRDPKTGARPDNDYPPDIQEFLNSEPGQRASEEMKALKITKSEYDEAMKFCVENLTDHKFGSVKDCLASVVEEMKGLRKVVEAAKFVPRNIVSTDPISIRVVANLKEALEDYDKNRGAV